MSAEEAPRTAPTAGDPVTVRFTKWDDTRHWTFPGAYLGDDEFGRWIGCPRGTVFDKPGRQVLSPIDFVGMFPHDGRWTPCFNEDVPSLTGGWPGEGTAIYTDITNHPEWRRDGDGWTVTMIDLDLDVVKRRDGTVYVADEDEFAEHQVVLNYPAYVVARARVDCATVFMAMEAGDEPYGSVGQAWLARYMGSR